MAQFNHPSLYNKSSHFNDFEVPRPGTEWAQKLVERVALIEVMSHGPQLTEGIGSADDLTGANLGWYIKALQQGWRVAPTISSDAHFGGYGDKAGTMLFLPADQGLSEDTVLEALCQRRTCASENGEWLLLSVPKVAGTSVTYQEMGSTLSTPPKSLHYWYRSAAANGDFQVSVVWVTATNHVVENQSKQKMQLLPGREAYDDGFPVKPPVGAFCCFMVVDQDGGRTVSAPIWFPKVGSPPAQTTTQPPKIQTAKPKSSQEVKPGSGKPSTAGWNRTTITLPIIEQWKLTVSGIPVGAEVKIGVEGQGQLEVFGGTQLIYPKSLAVFIGSERELPRQLLWFQDRIERGNRTSRVVTRSETGRRIWNGFWVGENWQGNAENAGGIYFRTYLGMGTIDDLQAKGSFKVTIAWRPTAPQTTTSQPATGSTTQPASSSAAKQTNVDTKGLQVSHGAAFVMDYSFLKKVLTVVGKPRTEALRVLGEPNEAKGDISYGNLVWRYELKGNLLKPAFRNDSSIGFGKDPYCALEFDRDDHLKSVHFEHSGPYADQPYWKLLIRGTYPLASGPAFTSVKGFLGGLFDWQKPSMVYAESLTPELEKRGRDIPDRWSGMLRYVGSGISIDIVGCYLQTPPARMTRKLNPTTGKFDESPVWNDKVSPEALCIFAIHVRNYELGERAFLTDAYLDSGVVLRRIPPGH